jgi:hypothetical protein
VWLKNARRYWPGRKWVDLVGSTMINFGGVKNYTVSRFAPALAELHSKFGKPVFLTETNTQRAGRVGWLDDLAGTLRTRPWIRATVWSQLPSRGAVQRKGLTGDLRWNVSSDPAAAAALRGVATNGSK